MFQNTLPEIQPNFNEISSSLPFESHKVPKHRPKKSEQLDDSLSLSRDKSKEVDSISSLISQNDHTILTFTKKDVFILD